MIKRMMYILESKSEDENRSDYMWFDNPECALGEFKKAKKDDMPMFDEFILWCVIVNNKCRVRYNCTLGDKDDMDCIISRVDIDRHVVTHSEEF